MIVKLLTEHHLEFLSLKIGSRGSSESTHVKKSNCWKSHALAHLLCAFVISSSAICIHYFIKSNVADIAKGYLPTSLLQARFDEYLLAPIRNLQNFV